jgi:hypothetical protein
VVDAALNRHAFGYDMNACEFALNGGVPARSTCPRRWTTGRSGSSSAGWSGDGDMCIARHGGRYQFGELNPSALASDRDR